MAHKVRVGSRCRVGRVVQVAWVGSRCRVGRVVEVAYKVRVGSRCLGWVGWYRWPIK